MLYWYIYPVEEETGTGHTIANYAFYYVEKHYSIPSSRDIR